MAAEPTILLLDEPAAGWCCPGAGRAQGDDPQDPRCQCKIRRHLAYNMSLGHECVGKTKYFGHGKVIAAGTPREVATNPEVIEAYLGRGAAEAAL